MPANQSTTGIDQASVRTSGCMGLILLLSLSLLFVSCTTTERHLEPLVYSHGAAGISEQDSVDSRKTTLRVMTLNMAHGRGDSFHQLFQTTDTTKANLDSIAGLLKREAPDVVSLQEADSRSFWNGNFDHVDFLAEHGSFGQSVRGTHVNGLGLAYGTALVAQLKLANPEAVTFDPGLSPVPKGFVVSTVAWPGNECVEVDIVSVHLDFISESIRRQQATELIASLRGRNRPFIIMGDFNTGWQQPDSAVRKISRELGLHAYQPESRTLATFPTFGERLDWILVSPKISFHSYRVVQDVVSDHLGVLSELLIDRTCPGSEI